MSVALREPRLKKRSQRPSQRLERLAPVNSDAIDTPCQLDPPGWLRLLHLPNHRKNLHCLERSTLQCKRILDVLVASLLLVIAFPIVVLAAIAIKLSSPGPVVFSQYRAGLFGKPFRIYKLRTMHQQASRQGPTQVQVADDRIFPVGRFLRRMRIDELPQLINVLRGEMSMVGPRPECIEYLEELAAKVPDYPRRLGLKPGLTGIAQIEGGYANDLESYRRKVAYDLLYLQHCCLANDLRILARTTKVVCTGFGAL